MISHEVDSVKEFIEELKNNKKFDSFYLYEARVKSRLDYYVNGKQNEASFDMDNQMESEYITWKDIKETIFFLFGENIVPHSFRIILMFSRDNIEKLIELNDLSYKVDDISALFFNLYYDGDKFTITTGSSMRTFSLDKSIEKIWDDTVNKYYI